MHEEWIRDRNIILFDGLCNLCNGSVIFVLRWEREPIFQFASIQSEAGQRLLERCGLPSNFLEAVVYLENGRSHLGSTAALRIGRRLAFPWSILASLGLLVPRFIRDRVYNQIARHRYKWFGKREVCMVPTGSLKARFL